MRASSSVERVDHAGNAEPGARRPERHLEVGVPLGEVGRGALGPGEQPGGHPEQVVARPTGSLGEDRSLRLGSDREAEVTNADLEEPGHPVVDGQDQPAGLELAAVVVAEHGQHECVRGLPVDVEHLCVPAGRTEAEQVPPPGVRGMGGEVVRNDVDEQAQARAATRLGHLGEAVGASELTTEPGGVRDVVAVGGPGNGLRERREVHVAHSECGDRRSGLRHRGEPAIGGELPPVGGDPLVPGAAGTGAVQPSSVAGSTDRSTWMLRPGIAMTSPARWVRVAASGSRSGAAVSRSVRQRCGVDVGGEGDLDRLGVAVEEEQQAVVGHGLPSPVGLYEVAVEEHGQDVVVGRLPLLIGHGRRRPPRTRRCRAGRGRLHAPGSDGPGRTADAGTPDGLSDR